MRLIRTKRVPSWKRGFTKLTLATALQGTSNEALAALGPSTARTLEQSYRANTSRDHERRPHRVCAHGQAIDISAIERLTVAVS